MRLAKLKCKIKKALAASARENYDQKRKGNKANTCIGNFLQALPSGHFPNLKRTFADLQILAGHGIRRYHSVLTGLVSVCHVYNNSKLTYGPAARNNLSSGSTIYRTEQQ